jgi:hypothetical protein
MKTLLAIFLLLSGISAIAATPQLNVRGFADCLKEKQSSVDLDFTRATYSPGDFDWMLPYLAFYPAHWPFLIEGERDRALKRWSGDFSGQEASLATALADLADRGTAVYPGDAFGIALGFCRQDPADLFCASLVLHNVLRTFGRHDQAVDGNEDLNPAWFQSEHADWARRLPRIQARLIPLRTDGGGDRWGEWYHFFGIFTYAIHEMAAHGELTSADLAARMNDLLNPLLVGSEEDPAKAQVDQDSVEVARRYLNATRAPIRPSCDSVSAYVSSSMATAQVFVH